MRNNYNVLKIKQYLRLFLSFELRFIRVFMPPVKTYRRACFAWAKDATTSFAEATDAKGNLQPTIYVYEKDKLIPKLCITRTVNLSNTQFRQNAVASFA